MRAATPGFLASAAIVFSGLTIPEATAQDGAQPESSVLGYWETPQAESVVELRRCPDRQELLCGHIQWLAEGERRTDQENPDPDLRDRPLTGLRVLSGIERADDGRWSVGEVYNPEGGRTFSGELRQLGPDTLELKGCALIFFCRTQLWERLPEDDPRLPDQDAEAAGEESAEDN